MLGFQKLLELPLTRVARERTDDLEDLGGVVGIGHQGSNALATDERPDAHGRGCRQ